MWDGARLGLSWGLGHTVSIAAAMGLVVVTGISFPPAISALAELGVAALLVILGVPILARYARGRWHMHAHTHDGGGVPSAGTPAPSARPHLHLHSHAREWSHEHIHVKWDSRRSLLLGLAHGLAGSAALVVLLLASAETTGARLAYFAAFGAGTIVGMLAVSAGLSTLVAVASRQGPVESAPQWASLLHTGAAVASVMAGIVLAARATASIISR
jgi:ABC-type nickel/cobalt efflux system permease component RcnA